MYKEKWKKNANFKKFQIFLNFFSRIWFFDRPNPIGAVLGAKPTGQGQLEGILHRSGREKQLAVERLQLRIRSRFLDLSYKSVS